jgi:hypothetical protein
MSREPFQHNAVSGSQPSKPSDAGGRNGGSTKRSVLGANNVEVLGKQGFHVYVHHKTPRHFLDKPEWI